MNLINSISYKEWAFGAGSLLFFNVGFLFAHECSHLTVIRALFTNTNAYMGCDSFFPQIQCHIKWNPAFINPELSITYETGRGVVSAAGPISDLIGVAVSSIATWKMRHSNRKISALFATIAFINALDNFFYAAITLGSDYGDFAEVESFLGIPHIIQTAIVGSVALGTTMLMKHILFSENPIGVNGKKEN